MKLAIFIAFFGFIHSQRINPLNVIQTEGFKGESYQVQTVDGYLLTIYRILGENVKEKKLPCFLMHGFSASSMEFLQLKNDSLAFILASNGYDVYLGNSRGTKFSSHVNFSVNSTQFWNFSWHEIGIYDLSAMLDYVLDFTGFENLFYIGMSQGTTAAMVLLSSKPEYNKKIIQAHLIGPAVFMGNSGKRLITSIAAPVLVDVLKKNQRVDLSPILNILREFLLSNCIESKPIGFALCIMAFYSSFGSNTKELEIDLNALRNIADVGSPYVSERQAKHFFQSIKSGKFKQFDYGRENYKVYGSTDAPEYNLKNVTIPIYLYTGGQDNVIDRRDVERLYKSLPNAVSLHIIENFNHYDYVAGRRAKDEIYLKILSIINCFGNDCK